MNKTELGSMTAKGGFANEHIICDKLNNWEKDQEAQSWLEIMGYNLNKINYVNAIQIPIVIKKIDAEIDIR